MTSKNILQDNKKPGRLSIFIMAIIMIVSSLFIVSINKKSEEVLRENTIKTYEGFQESFAKNTVATFNQVKDTLVRDKMENSNDLYEKMLIGNVKYSKIGDNGTTILLNDKYDYLYSRVTLNDVDQCTNFDELAQKYNKDFMGCVDQMKRDNEEGRCTVNMNNDIEHFYWHKIPSLGSTMNGRTYFLVLGFKEKDALANYSTIQTVSKISLVVQSGLLIVALFISMWAVNNYNYYHKKLKTYESSN